MSWEKGIKVAPGVLIEIGELVQYFNNGWRIGVVADATRKQIGINPTTHYSLRKKHNIWVNYSEVKKLEKK